jgi:hypothetical protein
MVSWRGLLELQRSQVGRGPGDGRLADGFEVRCGHRSVAMHRFRSCVMRGGLVGSAVMCLAPRLVAHAATVSMSVAGAVADGGREQHHGRALQGERRVAPGVVPSPVYDGGRNTYGELGNGSTRTAPAW